LSVSTTEESPHHDGNEAVSAVAAQLKRLWQGDSGMIPIVIGLLLLVSYFQIRSAVFLSAGNITNLFIQATVFVLLGMAEIWLLLLGEIDLSLGFTMSLGGATAVILTDLQFHWPWYAALLASLAVTTVISALQGLLVIGLKLPSFIVTLAGLLCWEGVLIWLVDSQGTGGTIPVRENVLYNLVNGDLTVAFTWIFVAAVVVVGSFLMIRSDRTRRSGGLETSPFFVLIVKIVAMAASAVVLAMVFDTNRGNHSYGVVVKGMPFAIPIDFAVVALGSFILTKTKAGRYIYAIGGNTEAARRGGVKVSRYRLFAFMMTGVTGGIAGLLYVSQLGGISDGVPGGTLVLYAVAAAVIGGTSLFGGRGKMVHAVIGGVVIATIYNGMALVGMSTATQYIATALVLLAAVTIDSLARRGSTELG
jgi:D-xylose transport system permease protein